MSFLEIRPLRFNRFTACCVIVFTLVVCPAQAETLLSNLDTARKDAKPSPFSNGNGKAIDFTVRAGRGRLKCRKSSCD